MSSIPLRLAVLGAAAVTALSTLLPASPALSAPADRSPQPAACAPTELTHRDSEAAPSCVHPEVTLDRLPAVGESATVRVRLRTQIAISRAQVSIRLPENLRIVSG